MKLPEDVKITCSDHALHRFKERYDLRPLLCETARIAFEEGENLTYEEFLKNYQKWMKDEKMGLNEYKKYHNSVFVFRPLRRGKITLITILPRV